MSVRALCLVVLAAAAVLVSLPDAQASHYRGGTMYAIPTTNANEVRFEGYMAYRLDSVGSPPVGTIYSDWASLDFGDSTSVQVYMESQVVNTLQNWVVGRLVMSDGSPILHTYSSPTNGGQPWQASVQSCCRLGNPDITNPDNHHINNPDASWRLETTVVLGPPADSPPIPLVPPIAACLINSLCALPILHSDADPGDVLSARFSTGGEATGGSFNQPGPAFGGTGACPSPVTMASLPPGQLCIGNMTLYWHTDLTAIPFATPYYTPEPPQRSYYSVQLMLQDHVENVTFPVKEKVPIDFFIRLTNLPPPRWLDPSPCNANPSFAGHEHLKVFKGTTLNFQLRAQADATGTLVADPARAPVTFLPFGTLPTGFVLGAASGGNPGSMPVTYTPPAAIPVGSTVSVPFLAQDGDGVTGSICQVFIDILDVPDTDFTRHYTDSPMGLSCGAAHSDTSGFTLDGVGFQGFLDPVPGGPLVQAYEWDFGDPNDPLATAVTAHTGHGYSDNGIYDVNMIARPYFQDAYYWTTPATLPDANGITKQVDIKNRCPTAIPGGTVTGPLVRARDYGTDLDGTIVSRSWDFGDLTPPVVVPAADPFTDHTYTVTGIYTICVTNMDDDGATGTACMQRMVRILPPPPPDSDHDGVADTIDQCPGQDDSQCNASIYWSTGATTTGGASAMGPHASDRNLGGDTPDTAAAGSTVSEQRAATEEAPDTDRDGIADVQDNCPETPNADQTDLDGDGRGDLCDLDRDGDGVPDRAAPPFVPDNCPLIPNVDQRDADGDGLGDACDEAPGELRTPLALALAGESACPSCDSSPPLRASLAGSAGPTPATVGGWLAAGGIVVAVAVALVLFAVRPWKP